MKLDQQKATLDPFATIEFPKTNTTYVFQGVAEWKIAFFDICIH